MMSRVGMAGAALLALAGSGCDRGGPNPSPPSNAPASAAASAGGSTIASGQPDAPGPEAPPGISVSDARVQLPAVPGRPGVAYLTVSSSGGPDRTIAAVHVAGAGRSEIHASMTSQGVSRMAPVSALALKPGQSVRFAPGGYHVMLFDLDRRMKAGGISEVTVVFADGDKASIAAPVSGPGGMPPSAGEAR